jgi:hypothetical protein
MMLQIWLQSGFHLAVSAFLAVAHGPGAVLRGRLSHSSTKVVWREERAEA